MTKRDVLLQICENPGWEPPNQGNGTERFVDELKVEGWIQSRLDGFHATAKAMDGYPAFAEQADIAEEERPEPAAQVDHGGYVPHDRVVALIINLLHEMPVGKVFALATTPAIRPPGQWPECNVAEHIVKEMGYVRIAS